MMFISVKDKLPQLTEIKEEQKFGFSDRVIVWENESYWFAKYHPGLNVWNVEGRRGNINVEYWSPLPGKEYFELFKHC